ncbi:MAG: 16S rRNA (guanine(527)-N(7))-methyltransferase RsmG [Candidatus Hydrogenedentes bacterium]|nr:16S rRNA (guanine(527)-N(7))-methyltransferase RsmG [Candidatus Hydrogenedentota bacterium]
MSCQLDSYVQLIRDWNSFVSLVSRNDLDLLEQVHLPDSLSLAPVIRRLREGRLRLLDIGSGGGFPAIPLKIVLPELQVELVERATRKVGFLEKVVSSLHLDDVRVVQGNFPEVEVAVPDVVTARAVGKPGKLLPRVLDLLPPGGVFLCQTVPPQLDSRFHVERVEDEWTDQGLRRGDLYLIRRMAV